MENASMTEISSGEGRKKKQQDFIIILLKMAVVIPIIWLATQDSSNPNEFRVFMALVMALIIALAFFFGNAHVAQSVFESADGMFLRVEIRMTEKTIPLSEIESVDIIRGGFNILQITVKHHSSFDSFSFGATFLFTPNEACFKSTLFRQFPLPDGIENLKDFRAWFLRKKM